MAFKICVIGCGQIAAGYHGPAYQHYAAQNADVTLAACCDIDLSKAVAFRERFGFQRSYQDYLSMLDQEKPDAVCLLVPPDQTCKMSCAILEKGFPLLTEKPSGRTVAELDLMITAARKTNAPTQVAFNRRYTPLVQILRNYLPGHFSAGEIQHIRYDFSRIDRRDFDFSTTAIHGIDAARFLIGSDYQTIRFHYQEFPALGPRVANILMDCTFTSGATGQLNFYPVSGVVTERATVQVYNHTFFLNLPIWNAFDSPGRLQHIKKGKIVFEITGQEASKSDEEFILNGFYGENASFFDDIKNGRRPEGSLETSRQSVEIADYIREKKTEYLLS
jgi:myo-inositol 2-dehydrogenase / D-chiro-inositol 1-dehydrogenase